MKPVSGIIFENNANIVGALPAPTLSNPYTQKFRLPADYPRGEERILPNLTGFQLFVETNLNQVTIQWKLERTIDRQNEVQQIVLNGTTENYKLSFRDQQTELIAPDATDAEIQAELEALELLSGNVVVQDLKVTFINRLSNLNVPELQVVDNAEVQVVQAIPAYIWFEELSKTETIDVVQKNGKAWVDIEFNVEVGNESLSEDWRFVFSINANPYYSIYAGTENIKAELYDETPIVASGSNSLIMLHRVLAGTLDSSVDFLGNNFRSAVKEYYPQKSMGNGANFWMSQPNPSKFAVESLYFDVRKNGGPSVINRLLIDPVTPGIVCNIYFSTQAVDGSPSSWDNLWWKPVPRKMELSAKKEFFMPFPVTASFIKLEFTQLQARPYSVGEHQQKIVYNKHPKWVLDHFYQIYLEQKQSNQIPTDTVSLRYNALDLYYNYFSDDLVESPFFPQLLDRNVDTDIFNDYLTEITTQELNNLDPETLNQIKTDPNPYAKHPLSLSPQHSLLGQYMPRGTMTNFPTESIRRPVADTEMVTTKNRESVQMDREFPAMSFYLPTRHQYKRSRATFENDRAYFAGIKQVAFYRDYYASETDAPIYSETAGDETNLEINDLVLENGEWTGQ